MSAGPLVVTYPLTGRSRAIVAEELSGTAEAIYLVDLAPADRAGALGRAGAVLSHDTSKELRCMIRRRAKAARIAAEIGCHTFRATGITAYLANGGALEHAQEMAAHESPRTTKLYDRTKERLTQDEVERIKAVRPELGPLKAAGHFE